MPIIEYVERTEKAVILHNANMEGQFINDPYIKNNALKSIFCIPILQHGNRTGIIYLENNILNENEVNFIKDNNEIIENIEKEKTLLRFTLKIQEQQKWLPSATFILLSLNIQFK